MNVWYSVERLVQEEVKNGVKRLRSETSIEDLLVNTHRPLRRLQEKPQIEK